MPTTLRRAVSAGLAVLVALAAAGSAEARQGYQIGQGDILKIAVWSQPELSGEFTVDVAGGITLPLIGGVKAEGQTIAQVEEAIRARLADGYIVNPQVTIDVAQFKSQRVFVVGEVKAPGVVPLSGALSLVEALTRVGSLTEFAGGDLVVIRPQDGKEVTGPVLAGDPGAREILRVDIQQLQSRGPTSNIDLRDGDTVVVPRAEMIFVNGQVNAPGRYTYERDMTILMAISKANGINDLGSTKRVKIIRIVDGKRVELKAEVSDKVLPGDTVQVGNRWF
jgi:polysaccharide export outer membrane protein